MYSGGIGIYYLNITPQSEAGTPQAKPYMPYRIHIPCFHIRKVPSSRAHLPLHGHIFPFMGTSSLSWAHLPLSWAHLPFHGHIFPLMGTSSPSWANLPLHGHVFSLICSHHSSPANLSMHQRTESEAKAKAKAKPNMMIICSCKPCLAHAMPRRLSNHVLCLSSPLQLKAWTASVP